MTFLLQSIFAYSSRPWISYFLAQLRLYLQFLIEVKNTCVLSAVIKLNSLKVYNFAVIKVYIFTSHRLSTLSLLLHISR